MCDPVSLLVGGGLLLGAKGVADAKKDRKAAAAAQRAQAQAEQRDADSKTRGDRTASFRQRRDGLDASGGFQTVGGSPFGSRSFFQPSA